MFKFRTRPCVKNVFHEEHMCSSAVHWKCPIIQNTFKAFNICCIFGVQIVFYTITNVLEHMQTFSTWCSNSSFPLNTMVFNITEHVQGVQYLLQFWRSDCVLNAYSSGHLVLSHLGLAFVLMLRPFFPKLVMSTDLLSFEHPSVLLFCSLTSIFTV